MLFRVEHILKQEKPETFYSSVEQNAGAETKQFSEETTNILKKETATRRVRHQIQQTETQEQLKFVHKSVGQTLEQQEINELLEQKKTTVENQKSQIELLEQITVLEKKVQETKQEVMIQNKKSITELIQKNLQNQINTISDQVYQNLEHRLWNERKRRGF